MALLLRHRLRVAGRADRERTGRRRDPGVHRRGFVGLYLTRRADRGERATQEPVVPGLLRRRIPHPAAGHCRQARARGDRALRQRRRPRGGAGKRLRRRGRPVAPVTGGSEASYAAAGVDIEAGERAVELMKTSVARTERRESLTGLGGFAGLFQLDLARYPQPVLACSTDGVGTKVAIAQAVDRHDTIGIDLVAMIVD